MQLSKRIIEINFISTFTQVSISSLNVDSLMDPNRDERTFQFKRPLNETPFQTDLLMNSKQCPNGLLSFELKFVCNWHKTHKYEPVSRFFMHPIIWCNLLQKHTAICILYFHPAIAFRWVTFSRSENKLVSIQIRRACISGQKLKLNIKFVIQHGSESEESSPGASAT